MSLLKRGDKVFLEAEFVRITNDERNGVMLEVNNNGNRFFLNCAPAIVHANLPGKPDGSPGVAERAWRSWVCEAIMYAENTALGSIDIAREIREGAAAGFSLAGADDEYSALRRRLVRLMDCASDLLDEIEQRGEDIIEADELRNAMAEVKS